jgi:hypothetical protein
MVLGFREREARPMSREVVVVMGRRAASVENWRGGRREMGEGGDRERRKRERERGEASLRGERWRNAEWWGWWAERTRAEKLS